MFMRTSISYFTKENMQQQRNVLLKCFEMYKNRLYLFSF